MGEPSTAEARDVAAILSFSVLRYVQRAVGKADAERLRIAAGETRSMGELLERGAWSSVGVLLDIADRAAALTGDVEIGRRSGEELFRFLREVGFTDGHRAKGSIEAALEHVIMNSSRASTGRIMTIVDRSATSLLVEEHSKGQQAKDRFFCDYSAGYWASIPMAFDTSGYAVQLECQSRGDERCLTQVSWVEPTTAVDVETSSARSNQLLVRHEELQQMAADLYAAEDVDVVLDLVVQRAGLAVLAPRFLLAVQLPDSPEVRLRHVGFRDDASARRAADAVLAGRLSTSTLVVDVASKRQHYGSFAALYPKGTESSEVDRRMMSSYATHVAAALEATSAHEQARRDRDTAQALLGLSSSLAGVVTVPDLSRRLADAIALIGEGCRGAIFLLDASTGRLRLQAFDADAARAKTPKGLVRGAIAGITERLGAGGPVILDVDEVTGDLRELMRASGIHSSVALPIVARGDLLGLVSASFDRRIGGDEQRLLIDRLSGLADQAATSLDNVRLLERTSYQATHDELTGLPNRSMLEDRANHALAAGRRNGDLSALLFVDLDRFKSVNDTLGHHAGDDLIRQVAARLGRVVRAADTLARLGGDEFVVLLSAVADEDAAVRVAERIVDTLAQPYTVAGQEVFVSGSVGIAVSSVEGTDYQTLLQRADAAMYEVKASGRNACATHAASTDRTDVKRLSIETALHGALAKGELSVVYQPQVDLASGAIIGAEALVRWHHPTLGTIAPDVFVPVAEEAGLIASIDRWVRRTALAEVKQWRQASPDFRISFNLSTRELRDPGLPAQLVADLTTAGVPTSAVELEITERVVMAHNEDLVGILNALHATGVRLAIDDFGTGSAVLGRLQRHPVDTLKIDRSFIGEITSVSSAAVVSAVLQMARVLGIDVIAEGIETETQRSVLSELGCPFAQGYLFSRPVPAEELGGLLRAAARPPVAMAGAAG